MQRGRMIVVAGTVILAALVAGTATTLAQRPGSYRPPQQQSYTGNVRYDGKFVFVRMSYAWNGGRGAPWAHDYPTGEEHFLKILTSISNVDAHVDASSIMHFSDPELFKFPVAYLIEPGYWYMSESDVTNLRAYLLKGGYLIADDFWGSRAWDQWEYEIGRVLPPHQYPIVEIAPTHPVMNVLYDVKEVEQVSNIRFWVQTGSTSERGSDSAHVNFRGISDDKGRLIVVMAHNTDIPDTWEREGESKEYFDKFSPNGYAVGVNVVLYGLTH